MSAVPAAVSTATAAVMAAAAGESVAVVLPVVVAVDPELQQAGIHFRLDVGLARGPAQL